MGQFKLKQYSKRQWVLEHTNGVIVGTISKVVKTNGEIVFAARVVPITAMVTIPTINLKFGLEEATISLIDYGVSMLKTNPSLLQDN